MFEVKYTSTALIIKLADQSKINIVNADTVKDTLIEFINKNNTVIFDLSSIAYVDSSGLGAILTAYHVAHNNNKKLILANIPNQVMDLLKIVKLNDIFTIRQTIEEALELSF